MTMATPARGGLRQQARAGQVARRDPAALKADIQKMQAQFQLAMPRGVEAQQLVRDALTVLSANPKLAEAEPKSVLGALMTCAQLGLRPNVLGQAYVIPFKGKAQLVIGYQGLLQLAQRSGDIASISARIAYRNDVFQYEFGLDEKLIHRPAQGDRGEAIAYYCVVKSTHGGTYWDVMSRADAEAHRDKFAMAREYGTIGSGPHGKGVIQGPWVEHFDAMALKTVIIRVLKLAPRNTELQQAIAADESVRVDLTPGVDITTVAVDVPDGADEITDGEIDGPPPGVDPATGEVPPGVEIQDPPEYDPTTAPDWQGGAS
jgi:recombination protein RecT